LDQSSYSTHEEWKHFSYGQLKEQASCMSSIAIYACSEIVSGMITCIASYVTNSLLAHSDVAKVGTGLPQVHPILSSVQPTLLLIN